MLFSELNSSLDVSLYHRRMAMEHKEMVSFLELSKATLGLYGQMV